jgi:hypothetical protein
LCGGAAFAFVSGASAMAQNPIAPNPNIPKLTNTFRHSLQKQVIFAPYTRSRTVNYRKYKTRILIFSNTLIATFISSVARLSRTIFINAVAKILWALLMTSSRPSRPRQTITLNDGTVKA